MITETHVRWARRILVALFILINLLFTLAVDVRADGIVQPSSQSVRIADLLPPVRVKPGQSCGHESNDIPQLEDYMLEDSDIYLPDWRYQDYLDDFGWFWEQDLSAGLCHVSAEQQPPLPPDDFDP